MEHAVTLMEMLGAREARAMRQQQLLEEYRLPVISFCLNVAGPVKNSPVLRRAFREGLERLVCALLAGRLSVVHREEVDQPTGCEALWVVRGDGRRVKELCVEHPGHPGGLFCKKRPADSGCSGGQGAAL